MIRNGRRDSPEHTYGSFEFPSLGPVLDGDVLQGSVSGSSGWDWVRRAVAVAVAECFLSGAGLVSRYDRVAADVLATGCCQRTPDVEVMSWGMGWLQLVSVQGRGVLPGWCLGGRWARDGGSLLV